jgi:hypothetical protein
MGSISQIQIEDFRRLPDLSRAFKIFVVINFFFGKI